MYLTVLWRLLNSSQKHKIMCLVLKDDDDNRVISITLLVSTKEIFQNYQKGFDGYTGQVKVDS